MEGSREEVVRYIRLVESEFQNPDERTSTAKAQDWAVNLAWGGSAALAASGMMKNFRRDGDEYDALMVQLRGSKELLMHPPALSIPGCPAGVYGDTAMTSSSRWRWPFDPFQLPRGDSSLWVKVVMVPGDAVAVPKWWWHAARSIQWQSALRCSSKR